MPTIPRASRRSSSQVCGDDLSKQFTKIMEFCFETEQYNTLYCHTSIEVVFDIFASVYERCADVTDVEFA